MMSDRIDSVDAKPGSVGLAYLKGRKIFVADVTSCEKFPPKCSLGITFSILGAGDAFCLWKTGSSTSEKSVIVEESSNPEQISPKLCIC